MMSSRRDLGNQTFKAISGIPPSGMVGWLLPALLVDHKLFPIVSHIATGTSFAPAYLPTSDGLSLSQREEYTNLAAKALSVTTDVAGDHSTTLAVNHLHATEDDDIPHLPKNLFQNFESPGYTPSYDNFQSDRVDPLHPQSSRIHEVQDQVCLFSLSSTLTHLTTMPI